MKANRKFIRGDDAVSPVIAVILMVAITVVLAATVYVWVSGFGAQSSNPAKTLSMTSNGPISEVDSWDTDLNNDGSTTTTDVGAGTDGTTDYYRKSFTISSATAGMKYTDISLTIDGAAVAFSATNCDPATNVDPSGTTGNLWSVCTSALKVQDSVVTAGDELLVQFNSDLSGKTLRVLDTDANSVMLTLTIG